MVISRLERYYTVLLNWQQLREHDIKKKDKRYLDIVRGHQDAMAESVDRNFGPDSPVGQSLDRIRRERGLWHRSPRTIWQRTPVTRLGEIQQELREIEAEVAEHNKEK